MNLQNSGRVDAYREVYSVYAGESGGSNGNPRSEKSADHRPLKYGKAYHWSFSLDLPNWPHLPAWCINFQAHAKPNEGQKGRTPVFAIQSNNGEYKMVIRAGESETMATATTPFTEHGHWDIYCVFDSANGSTKVVKDGDTVIDYVGANCYDDIKPPYLKWGIYMSDKVPAHYGKLTAEFGLLSGFY